jgi:hypothetical protein
VHARPLAAAVVSIAGGIALVAGAPGFGWGLLVIGRALALGSERRPSRRAKLRRLSHRARLR